MKVLTALLAMAAVAASSDPVWVRTYNGPGNGDDEATCLAVDANGNVCVSGGSHGYGTQYDYATICYRPNGDTAWFERYMIPGIGWDIAQDLAFDADGNVIVTGYSWDQASPYDWATVKYDPNGVELWARRFGGAAGNEDRAYALALDSTGAVRVTGTSNGYRPDTTEFDIVIHRYSAGGDSTWVKMLDVGDTDAAVDIALDAAGNACVTGFSQGRTSGLDFMTAKFRPDGETAWTRRHDGPAGGRDEARGLALDGAASVYVIGTCTPAPGADGDWAVVKYDSAGSLLWVRSYDGLSADQPGALAIDHAGNVIVTGYTSRPGQSWDWLTIKYRPNGDTVWTRIHNGPGSGPDLANALVVDRANNVIVTGLEYCDSLCNNIRTICYDSAGTAIWSASWSGPGSFDDEAVAVVTDSLNAVYVAGHTGTAASGNDYVLLKYTAEPGIEETPGSYGIVARRPATVVRGVLVRQAIANSQSPMAAAALLDASGRKVFDLKPGANNVSQLAPGVYFVRTAMNGQGPGSADKVVIAK